MEKFKKFITTLEKGLKALFIAFLVISFVMIGFAIIGIFGGASLIGEADTYLTFGALKLTVAKDSIVTENADVMLIVTAALMAVRFALACVLVKLLQNIIAPMKGGTLFVDAVHRGLISLAKFVLCGGIIATVANIAGSFLIFNSYDIGSLFDADKVVAYSLSIKDDCGFIVIAAALFLLSYVFKYGAELQNQVDETL